MMSLLTFAGGASDAFGDSYAVPITSAAQLSSGAVTNIQNQLQASIDVVNAKKLSNADRDAAFAAAVAQIMIQSEQSYGANNVGGIASIILASTAIPAADIGSGLGQAAAQMAVSSFGVGKAAAQAVANEGNASAVDGCASGAEQAGSHGIAEVCEGKPTVTGFTGENGTHVGLGFGNNNVGFVPPAAPAPACSSPSCT